MNQGRGKIVKNNKLKTRRLRDRGMQVCVKSSNKRHHLQFNGATHKIDCKRNQLK